MIRTAILGASGYSGAELLRLLGPREDVELVRLVAATSAGKPVAELYPWFDGDAGRAFDPPDTGALDGLDLVFSALPSGEAMNVIPQLLPRVGRIIDLGGDFRLPSAALYREYYGREHTAPGLLAESVYGLPELDRGAIRGARLLANPGCYPTSAILGLLPALIHGVVFPAGIVVNSLSGVSGAGRSASVEMSFAEVNENVRAYRIGSHQHIPEIETVLGRAAGTAVSCSFVPHLVPLTRGIHTTIHAPLASKVGTDEVRRLYEDYYRDAPFVRVKRDGVQVSGVARTNYCDISIAVETRTRHLIVTSAIDNLVKGAAGQAIQNMNIMFDLPQERGLR